MNVWFKIEIISLISILCFNTLSKSIEENNLERFQSLCYYHRLAIELLVDNDVQIDFATASFIRYGNIASKNVPFGKKRFIWSWKNYSFFAYDSEELGITFLKNHASLVWKELPKEGKWGNCWLFSKDILGGTLRLWRAKYDYWRSHLTDMEKHRGSLEYLFTKKKRPFIGNMVIDYLIFLICPLPLGSHNVWYKERQEKAASG